MTFKSVCRNEPALSRLQWNRALAMSGGAPCEKTFARKNDEQGKTALSGLRFRQIKMDQAVNVEPIHCKIGTFDQMVQAPLLAFDPTARRDFADGIRVEIHHFKSFVDVKFARLPAGVDAAVIVDAIREVRILLDFTDDHVRTDGVWRAGRNKEGVIGVNGMPLEEIFKSVIL